MLPGLNNRKVFRADVFKSASAYIQQVVSQNDALYMHNQV